MVHKYILLFMVPCIFGLSSHLKAQNTFQKVYSTGYDVECFGAYQETDGGYIRIAQVSASSYKVFMTRTDCHGNILWSRAYNTSSTIGNISQRVVETHDHGFMLAASIGSYGAYNILLVRTDVNGNTIWKKVMQGSGDDLVNSVIETTSHDFIVAGSTSSFGQDAGSFYKDIYLMKVDENGNFTWGKTFGTAGSYDEAFDVVETYDGKYAATGRYIVSEAFHCFLLKTDTAGYLLFMKAYGDTLQNVSGYALANTFDGGLVITGSSTLTKGSFLDYGDEFLIKTNTEGDTTWCKSYHGSNIDGSENGSSVIALNDGGFAVGVATFSYPTSGFVPNKHCILKTNAAGNMTWVKAYNDGGSHYAYLTAAKGESGFVLSGFGNEYTPHFSPMIIKMNDAFESGCYETDYTSLTTQEHMPAKVKTPLVLTGSGGSLIDATVESEFEMNDSVLCSSFSDSCFVFTEVNTLDKNTSLYVFPNPAHGKVEIVLPDFSDATSVSIFSPDGRQVMFREITNEDRMILDVSKLTPGFYTIKMNSTNRLNFASFIVQ